MGDSFFVQSNIASGTAEQQRGWGHVRLINFLIGITALRNRGDKT